MAPVIWKMICAALNKPYVRGCKNWGYVTNECVQESNYRIRMTMTRCMHGHENSHNLQQEPWMQYQHLGSQNVGRWKLNKHDEWVTRGGWWQWYRNRKKIYNNKQSKTHIVRVSGEAINPDNSASEAEMIAAVAGSKWSASKGNNNWPRGYNGSVTPGASACVTVTH